MTVKITISVDEQVKHSLSALARKNKNTVSGFISEMVRRESIRESIPAGSKGLGSLLRSHGQVLKEDSGKDYNEILGKLREEKHLT